MKHQWHLGPQAVLVLKLETQNKKCVVSSLIKESSLHSGQWSAGSALPIEQTTGGTEL